MGDMSNNDSPFFIDPTIQTHKQDKSFLSNCGTDSNVRFKQLIKQRKRTYHMMYCLWYAILTFQVNPGREVH